MCRSLSVVLAIVLLAATSAPTPDFAYDRGSALDIRTLATTRSGNIEIRNITFRSGYRQIGASLVRPLDRAAHAGIVFVHWLGDAKTTNRSEFMPDVLELAAHGATSLLVDAMWAQPDWFDRRTTAGDYAASIAQVVALRRALDVLGAQSDVDSARIAYVGH